jgi:SAM-dependent methyltransferase
LPFADGSFDRVLTINTVYFWPDLPTALTEVGRVLAAGGLLAIGIRDPSAMQRVSRDIFTVRPVEESRGGGHVGGVRGCTGRLTSGSEGPPRRCASLTA